MTLSGDIAVNGGDITTTATTFNLVNGTATTVNIAGAATSLNMGSSSGTLTIGNPTVVGTNTTQNLWNSTATTINFGGAAAINMSASGKTTAIAGAATVAQTLGVTGATTLSSTLTVSGAAQINNTLTATGATTLQSTLAVSAGTTLSSTLAVSGTATFSGATTVNNSLTVQNGQTFTTNTIAAGGGSGTFSGTWTLAGGAKMQATYADLAERYTSDEPYEPGTVLMIGGEREVTLATLKGKHRLAGIVSTNPAYVLNAMSQNSVIIGLAGRVPCFVIGTIEKGDMLTISAIPGVATSTSEPVAVIGRALENYDSNEVGVIEVMIGRA
jgi:hypothetical protein